MNNSNQALQTGLPFLDNLQIFFGTEFRKLIIIPYMQWRLQNEYNFDKF